MQMLCFPPNYSYICLTENIYKINKVSLLEKSLSWDKYCYLKTHEIWCKNVDYIDYTMHN